MKRNGRPTRAGQVFPEAGVVASAVQADDGLCWEVRREGDGLIRVTKRLAHTTHWVKS
jgi:hypothetical protein